MRAFIISLAILIFFIGFIVIGDMIYSHSLEKIAIIVSSLPQQCSRASVDEIDRAIELWRSSYTRLTFSRPKDEVTSIYNHLEKLKACCEENYPGYDSELAQIKTEIEFSRHNDDICFQNIF